MSPQLAPEAHQQQSPPPPRHSLFWPRTILGLLLGSMVLLPSMYQPYIDSLYTTLSSSSLYRASTFETFWTVLLYAIIEVTYTYRFGHNPQLRLTNTKSQIPSPPSTSDTKKHKPLPKMQRPQHRLKEGITYILPLLAMDLTMIKKFKGVSADAIAKSGNHDPSTAEIDGNFLNPTLHHFTLSSPLQTQRALPVQAPTTRQLVLQLATALFIYDTLFFLFHLLLHHPPTLSFPKPIRNLNLKFSHAKHHTHEEIHPQITNKLSIPERLSLIMLANFSLNIIGAHVLTRTCFVPLFVWLLVDIHSGLDLSWGYDNLLPRGWGAGSKRHALHHRFGNRYYEPFFCWWDNLYTWLTVGTEKPG